MAPSNEGSPHVAGMLMRSVVDLPATDRSRALIETTVDLVPCTQWAFARYADGDAICEFLVSERFRDVETILQLLQEERTRQRREARSGPRTAATLVPVAPYAYGVTMLFADRRATYAMLVCMRDESAGPYSSTEIQALWSATLGGSDMLARLRIFDVDGDPKSHALERAVPTLYVVDKEMRVESFWNPHDDRPNTMSALLRPENNRLPPILEKAVRAMTEGWFNAPERRAVQIAMPLPFLIVRAVPMDGAAGPRIGVIVERYQPRNSLMWAADRFSISDRELEVLGLLLKGESSAEIADHLSIAESTAHDHVKRLLAKTESRNRAEMIAKILGWRVERRER
ncbi:LuxR family transcriptional regulator [bacterium]|nr:MAG: LuxR family transcriptional regulator [bacterium]